MNEQELTTVKEMLLSIIRDESSSAKTKLEASRQLLELNAYLKDAKWGVL